MRRTAYLLCGDWHLADDLAQITFVRLATAWDRVREPAALDAFTRTTLIRVYLSESRRMWRRRERSTALLPEPGVADHAERVDTRHSVVAAMKSLPPRQRATLVCRYYQGLNVKRAPKCSAVPPEPSATSPCPGHPASAARCAARPTHLRGDPMTELDELFREAVSAPPPSRLTATAVLGAAGRRHRRQAALAAAVVITLGGLVSIGITGLSLGSRNAANPPGSAAPPGSLIWAGRGDATHLYRLTYSCGENPRLPQSYPATATPGTGQTTPACNRL